MPDRPIADVVSIAERERLERAAKLRELMERKWRLPGVAHAHRRCKWQMPIKLGGDHGLQDDIADDNISEPKR